MSDPTKVTSITKVSDSGSSSRPASSLKLPAGTHENRRRSRARWAASRPSTWISSSSPQTNDAHGRRTPRIGTAAARTCVTVLPSRSVLQQVGVVHGRRPPGPEDRHDDGETDDDLGRGDEHDEQRDHLTVEVTLDAGERHEGEVGRVEHELDA